MYQIMKLFNSSHEFHKAVAINCFYNQGSTVTVAEKISDILCTNITFLLITGIRLLVI